MQVSESQAAHVQQQIAVSPLRNVPTPTSASNQVAADFEGMFLSMLIKQMRESLDEGMFGGENSDTYGAMFDLYMGDHLAQQGGLGIRQLVLSQISELESQGAQ